MAEPAYTSTQVNGKEPIHELSHRGFSSCILIDDTPVQIYRPEYETFTGLLAEPLEDKRIMTCVLSACQRFLKDLTRFSLLIQWLDRQRRG